MQRSWAIILPLAIGLGLPLACSSDEDDDDDNDSSATATGGSNGIPVNTSVNTSINTSSNTNTSTSTGGRATIPIDETGGTEPVDSTGGSTSSPGTGGIPATTDYEPCESGIEGLEETCLSQATFSEPNPVNILLVIDKSGSMTDESVYGASKWAALTQALTAALNETVDNPYLSLGLSMFPAKDTDPACQDETCCSIDDTVAVDVTPASFAVPSIIEELESTSPGGLTPTSSALDQALAYYASRGDLVGDKYVLLATDGGPNCNGSLECDEAECTINLDGNCSTGNCCGDSETTRLWCVDHVETRAKIAALADQGVKTIVVGIPGTEAYAGWLDAFAVAGEATAPEGSNRSYYEVSADGGVGSLTDTFRDITVNLVRSCRIQLVDKPPSWSVSLVNVAIDCKVVPGGVDAPPDTGAAGSGAAPVQGNWYVDETTDPPTIQVLGTYCDQIEEGVDRVDIVIGCPRAL